MTLAVVQSATAVDGTRPTPYNFALGFTPGTGNAMVVFLSQRHSSASDMLSSINDGQGGTWTKLYHLQGIATYQPINVEAWICYSLPANVTTLACTYNVVTTNDVLYTAIEVSGVAGSGAQAIGVRDTSRSQTSRTFDTDVDTVTQIAANNYPYMALACMDSAYSASPFEVPDLSANSPWGGVTSVTSVTPVNQRQHTFSKIRSVIDDPESIVVNNVNSTDEIHGIIITLEDRDMARTAIPVTVVAAYQAGTAVSTVAGDAANDHSVDLARAPKLVLCAEKSSANSVSFTVELPAGKYTYNSTQSKSHTMAAGESLYVIVVDVPPDLAQTGNVLHIDSADANFSDLSFFAYTWADTPTR